jgi:hypothetical protein
MTRRICLFVALMCFGLPQAAAELNVSITVFDPGVPEDASTHRELLVFPKIRRIEALFLPFVLRRTIVDTGGWGAVRVVPELDIAAELLVTGTILDSDGESLKLQVQAVDASGRFWIDKAYVGEWADTDPTSGKSGYQDLYDAITKDLVIARDALVGKALKDIVEISRLRYAVQLAPSAFGDFLTTTPDGRFALNRLPAESDPMLERIERIRGVEYVITDTVDEKYQELYVEVVRTYELWRKYRRQFTQYQIEEAQRQVHEKSDAPRGSYEAIRGIYDNYRWDRMAAQEQEHWARGFDNEVGPAVQRMESRVAELEGWVDDQYAEWQRLLAEIFELETGLTE